MTVLKFPSSQVEQLTRRWWRTINMQWVKDNALAAKDFNLDLWDLARVADIPNADRLILSMRISNRICMQVGHPDQILDILQAELNQQEDILP